MTAAGTVLRSAQGSKRNETGAGSELRLDFARRLQRQPRLADPTRARESEQPRAADA
jgi:hypothetical protein